MKQLKLLLFVIAVSLVYTSSAQTMPRHAISSGGGNFESASAHVSWTIGQSEPVSTIYQPTIILHGGFQQYVAIPVSIQEVENEDKVLLYPNPCNDYVILELELRHNSETSYQLYDAWAKLLLSKTIPGQTNSIKEIIDLSSLSPGIYNLKLLIRNEKSWSIQSIKLIRQ